MFLIKCRLLSFIWTREVSCSRKFQLSSIQSVCTRVRFANKTENTGCAFSLWPVHSVFKLLCKHPPPHFFFPFQDLRQTGETGLKKYFKKYHHTWIVLIYYSLDKYTVWRAESSIWETQRCRDKPLPSAGVSSRKVGKSDTIPTG